MITKKQILENAKNHPLGGKMVRFGNEQYDISLVGGRRGLYGDFDETFELAILDKKSQDKKFVTKDILGGSDDVCGYMSIDEIRNITNKLFKDGFQFFP